MVQQSTLLNHSRDVEASMSCAPLHFIPHSGCSHVSKVSHEGFCLRISAKMKHKYLPPTHVSHRVIPNLSSAFIKFLRKNQNTKIESPYILKAKDDNSNVFKSEIKLMYSHE